MGLVQVLICTFQEQPPVYAVPQQQQPPPQPAVMNMNSNVPYPTSQSQSPYSNSYATPYPAMPNMPMPGVQSPPATMQQPTQSFNVRPSLLSATEEKLKRRLEDIYFATEIEKKVSFVSFVLYYNLSLNHK